MNHCWAVKYVHRSGQSVRYGLYRWVRYPIPQLIERRRGR